MNKILKSLGLLVLVLTVFTTFSCSSDDEDNTPAAKLVAGLYSGWTKGDCQYFKNRTQNGESVAISSNDDGTIDVKLTSQMWGETTIHGVKVEKTGNGLNLSGSGKFAMGMGDKQTDYDCNLTGTISADRKTYSIAFNMPAVMGGLTITFAQGEAPAEESVAGLKLRRSLASANL